TEAPAAYGELISIGGLGPSVNAKLSSTVADILQTKLSIDSSRFYIKFYDVQIFYGAFVKQCFLAFDDSLTMLWFDSTLCYAIKSHHTHQNEDNR
ncbi:hypothetical protein Goari_005473, partial [Gossypium aridum]|nr:hypothetical protein [Gossypium aridum]